MQKIHINQRIHYRESLPEPDEYRALYETAGWNERYQAGTDELMAALSNSWYTICAYEGRALVGFGRVVTDQILYAMIYDMIVHPSCQKRGIGSAILKRIVTKCRSAGIRKTMLMAAPGRSGFYRRRGFEIRTPDFPGMQMVTREKP